jgi:hypothetical protein
VSGDDEYSPGKYSPSEWDEIAGTTSFGDLPTDQALLLYRHWLWADYSHQVYEDELEIWMEEKIRFDVMGRDLWALYVWSGLLFVVIEGMTQRRIRFGGRTGCSPAPGGP